MADVWDYAPLLGAPFYLALLVWLARIMLGTMREWPNYMARWNERQRDKESEKANDWTRLRDEIARLSAALRDEREQATVFRREQLTENERCRRDLADAVGRIAQLEGWQAGQGDVRQAAALAAAEVRRAERKEKGKSE